MTVTRVKRIHDKNVAPFDIAHSIKSSDAENLDQPYLAPFEHSIL